MEVTAEEAPWRLARRNPANLPHRGAGGHGPPHRQTRRPRADELRPHEGGGLHPHGADPAHPGHPSSPGRRRGPPCWPTCRCWRSSASTPRTSAGGAGGAGRPPLTWTRGHRGHPAGDRGQAAHHRRADPSAARDELLHTMACKAGIKGGGAPAPGAGAGGRAVMSGQVRYCPMAVRGH